jgi:hypothetical protein
MKQRVKKATVLVMTVVTIPISLAMFKLSWAHYQLFSETEALSESLDYFKLANKRVLVDERMLRIALHELVPALALLVLVQATLLWFFRKK